MGAGRSAAYSRAAPRPARPDPLSRLDRLKNMTPGGGQGERRDTAGQGGGGRGSDLWQ